MQPKPDKKAYYILIVTGFALMAMLITTKVIYSSIVLNPNSPEHIQVLEGEETVGYLEVTKKNKLKLVGLETTREISAEKPINISKLNLEQTLFHRNPDFLIWVMLIVMMSAIAAGGVPAFIAKIFELKANFKLSVINILIAFGFAISLLAVIYIISIFQTKGIYKPDYLIYQMKILLKNGDIIGNFVGIVMLLQIPVFMVIFLIGPAADRITFNLENGKEIERAAEKFVELEAVLLKGLQIIAVLVVFSVLTSFALGESIKAEIAIESFNIFPEQMIYAYGLYFSIFLGLIYFPAHLYLKYKGGMLNKKLNEVNFKEKQSWVDGVKKKFALEQTAMDNLKVALTVVAPFITSFLPEQFNLL